MLAINIFLILVICAAVISATNFEDTIDSIILQLKGSLKGKSVAANNEAGRKIPFMQLMGKPSSSLAAAKAKAKGISQKYLNIYLYDGSADCTGSYQQVVSIKANSCRPTGMSTAMEVTLADASADLKYSVTVYVDLIQVLQTQAPPSAGNNLCSGTDVSPTALGFSFTQDYVCEGNTDAGKSFAFVLDDARPELDTTATWIYDAIYDTATDCLANDVRSSSWFFATRAGYCTEYNHGDNSSSESSTCNSQTSSVTRTYYKGDACTGTVEETKTFTATQDCADVSVSERYLYLPQAGYRSISCGGALTSPKKEKAGPVLKAPKL